MTTHFMYKNNFAIFILTMKRKLTDFYFYVDTQRFHRRKFHWLLVGKKS